MKLIRTLHSPVPMGISASGHPFRHALKEWAIAVDALTRGETILLLRKGGIRETGGRFQLEHPLIWLYPTYEHQNPCLLQPAYASAVQPVSSGWHPPQVVIQSWAAITHILTIANEQEGRSLLPYQIWNDQFLTERLHWKPHQPLYGLLLRVHRLQNPQSIPFHPAYGGCKSWIELGAELDAAAPSTPVFSDEAYGDRVREILA